MLGLNIVQETKLGHTRREPAEGEIINSILNIWSLRSLHISRGSPMYVVSMCEAWKGNRGQRESLGCGSRSHLIG